MPTAAAALLPEFDHEMATTRTLLERIPEERADWRPHPKSWTLGQLSLHLANLPNWGILTMTRTEFDAAAPAPAGQPPRTFVSTPALLASFDEKVRISREAIAAASDDDLRVQWTLRSGEHTILSMPRLGILRSFVVNHLIHHRGQLTVYLRLCDVPLPPIYGPTADSRR